MQDILKSFEESSKTLAAKIKALQDQAKSESQEVIKTLFDAFFAKHGKHVYAVYWTQYTPYFNDGEECTFGVNDINLALSEETYNDGDDDSYSLNENKVKEYEEHLSKWKVYEENPEAAYNEYVDSTNRQYANSYYKPRVQSFNEWTPTYYEKEDLIEKLNLIGSGAYSELVNDFNRLKKVIEGIDDGYMQMIYGDHAKVAYFGPDGRLDVDEYSHD